MKGAHVCTWSCDRERCGEYGVDVQTHRCHSEQRGSVPPRAKMWLAIGVRWGEWMHCRSAWIHGGGHAESAESDLGVKWCVMK